MNEQQKLLNYDTKEHEFFNPDKHEMFQTKNGMTFIRNKMTGIDRVMTDFATKVNSHPDMNVRMLWQTRHNRVTRDMPKNDPDYWLGVVYAAYTKSVIDRNEFTDILLALQGAGAKSTYFKDIVQKLGRGEI